MKNLIKINKRIKKYLPFLAPYASIYGWLLYNNFAKIVCLFRGRKYREIVKKISSQHINTKGIIVHPSLIDWYDDLFHRTHQFALRFAQRNYLFFFCSPFFYKQGIKKIHKNLYLCSCDVMYALDYIKPDFLYLTPRLNVHEILKKFSGSKIIYDFLDDITIFSWYGIDRAKASHNVLLSKAHLILASADSLYKEVSGIHKNIILCPNGVDYNHFNINKKRKSLIIKNKIMRLKGPVIGYYGAFAQWVDFDLIKYIAKKRKNYNIVLIGKDFGNYLEDNKIADYNNIHYLGPKNYKILPKYLYYFDVAIIPFKINKITNATSPIKLFEYMAAGKPIVTTNINECKKYKEVFVSKNYQEFITNIDKAFKYKDNREYQSLLEKNAKNNDWNKRVKLICESLEQMNMYSTKNN